MDLGSGNTTVTSDSNPAQNASKNGPCILGPDAEDTSSGWDNSHGDFKYCSEVRWDVSTLTCNGGPLQSGHIYRVQFMVHDGDSTSDVVQACATVVLP